MIKPRQSILSVYYTFLIFIMVVFLILFSALFRNQISALNNLKKSEKYIDISISLFSAVKSFGFERGRVNVVLSYKGSASDKMSDIDFYLKNRDSGEASVSRALESIEKLSIPDAAGQLKKLKEMRRDVGILRQQAEEELKKSFSSRDPEFNARWFNEMSGYIQQISLLAVRFNGLISDIGLAGKNYITMLENATLLRDNSGPVCSYTAAAILSPEKFDEAQQQEILIRYSKIQENVYRIKLAAGNLKDTEITELVNMVENRHVVQLQAAIDSTLASLNDGRPFEYSQVSLTRLAVTALNSIKELVDLSGIKLQSYIRNRKNEKYNILTAYSVIFLMTLLFFLNFIYLLNNKIYVPIRKIISKLRRLSEGDTNIDVCTPKYNDEIADLMISVRSFRDALIQISASHDILEKKVVERTEELAGKAEEIETILNNIPVMIFFNDTHNNVIRVNKAAGDVIGRLPEEFGVYSSTELFPQHHIKYARDDRKVIETKEPVYNIIEKLESINGEERDICTSKIPVFNSVGDVEYILVVASDITELTKAQQEKELSYQLLTQQSKMAEIGSMIGVMSHQLKQPLNIISLLAESLEGGNDDFEYTKKAISDTVMFMASTIDEFLEFFKPSKSMEKFLLGSVVREVYSLVQKQFEKQSIEFEIINEIPVVIIGYKNEMKQIILNIMSNSRDAFESNGVKLRKISVRFELAEGAAHVTICDNAGGIHEELLPDRIFELYTSTKGADGNGIGLFICKNIMEEHMKGTIQAFNSGEGACFRLSFKEFLIRSV